MRGIYHYEGARGEATAQQSTIRAPRHIEGVPGTLQLLDLQIDGWIDGWIRNRSYGYMHR